jgi:uncharacterized membrane protein YfcA
MDGGVVAIEILGGLAVGLSLGLIGAGGAILSVPIFALVLGHATQVAVLEALVVTGAVASVAGARAAVSRLVDLPRAAAFAVPGFLGAWLGGPLGKATDDRLQAALFALLALVAAWRLLRPQPADPQGEATPLRGRALGLALAAGFAIGVLTSLLGVGGGFLLVPALVLLARVPIKMAVGTSLVVIAANSAVAFASIARSSPESFDGIAWSAVAIVTACGIGGSLAGARLAARLPAVMLRRAFAAVLLFVSLAIALQAAEIIRTR